ncbi:hypothetical protein H2200_002610 [Cladophialophora chaetospira]|uniref:SH3 domain-containing protein n=1 Tax=Cladophialophora chaetospira TaxID=386627 RepID=A0AA38XJF3_9EURO|nr:hypothetical protein H2200_002610 [Cladophialophora chaetospira]
MVDKLLAKRQEDPSLTTVDGTVYSIAYVTATPTFTGVIGGYTTLQGSDSSATETSAAQESVTPSAVATSSESAAETSAQSVATPTSASLIAPAVASTTSAGIIGSTNTGSVAAASNSAASSTDTSSSSSTSSGGLSTGAKAGIAIGIIAIVGLVAIFLLWLLGKKRRQIEAQSGADNEKVAPAAGVNSTEMATRSPPISATAPRISLRPVSRMLPEFMGASNKSRLSAGNMLSTIGESDAASTRKTASPQPRGPSPTQPRGLGLASATHSSQDNNPSNPFADPQNPFADPEKQRVQAPAPLAIAPSASKSLPVAPAAAIVASGALAAATPLNPKLAAAKPASAPAPGPVPARAPAPVATPAPVPAPVIAPVIAPQAAQSQTPSPASSAPASPALVGAAGPGPEPAQGNVYRVLMDFAPSMEDELELKNAQLVRMLHEYDDGWALCIRLDRSQQGVVPRTCLAAKPSKPKPSHLNQYARPIPGGPPPRPMSPAGGPMSRPMSPAGGPPRPMSPAGRSMSPMGRPMQGGRPMSPAGRRPVDMRRPMSPGFNQAPRPMSPGPRPGQPRSMSPGPYGPGRNGPPPMATVKRQRSNSASHVREKRNSPAGPSKLGTGMAL